MLAKISGYIIAGLLAVIIALGISLYISQLHLKIAKTELQGVKDKLAVQLTTNADLEAKVKLSATRRVSEQKICQEAILDYQQMVKNCHKPLGPIQQINLIGCPTASTERDPTKDQILHDLDNLLGGQL